MFETIFYRALDRNKDGGLVVTSGGRERFLGQEDGRSAAILHVEDRSFFRKCVLYGEVGFGEAYVDGLWNSPDPMGVIEWFARNAANTPTFASSAANAIAVNVLGVVDRLRYLMRPNTLKISKKNIRDHYDLGNEFFQLFLDETMAYSCAVFKEPAESLLNAQKNKFQKLYQKLELKESDHLLEIGCGWGGFAVYAAKNSGCRVTGVTISRAQYDFACRKVKEEGLEGQVTILLEDYRNLSGKYSRIVSIEMMEALGYEYLDTFFAQCRALLEPGGIMAIQCITFPDASYDSYRRGMDWTRIHIFPGSLLLSVQRMLTSLKKTGNLMVDDLESIGLHYATTLRKWCDNFMVNAGEVKDLGFSEEFLRKWRYYFMFCEAGFANRLINDVQMVMHAPGRRAV
jgi:cyclopropane-fatty-acyl-phospholipid synthase